MEKAIHTAGFCLCIILSILFLAPLTQSCSASMQGKKASNSSKKSNNEAVEETSNVNPDDSDCVRGEPEPVLRDSSFKRLSQFTATEEYPLNQNIKLTINHFGCTHFAERYHFKIKKKPDLKNDWRLWMSFAADQLVILPARKVVKEQIKVMASTLKNHARKAVSYVYNSEISISETEFLSFDVKPTGDNSTEIIILYQFVL